MQKSDRDNDRLRCMYPGGLLRTWLIIMTRAIITGTQNAWNNCMAILKQRAKQLKRKTNNDMHTFYVHIHTAS
jgi:hypothetical protein